MTFKPLLMLPGLGLVCLLSACAGPMPKADPSEAFIGLEQPGSADLLAQRIDGQQVNEGRYFEVKPGAHRLDMTLISGADGNSLDLSCTGHLSYSEFKAGEHYQVNASSEGLKAGVSLMDSHGNQLAQSRGFRCS